MEKKFDVIALGELLIDFTENGVSAQGNPIFEANPGGAPCNVLAMLNNLGKKTSFLGVVGKDQFGTSLRKTLNELKIDTSHLYENQEVHTTLAFVHTFEDGDRDFAFYRNPGHLRAATPAGFQNGLPARRAGATSGGPTRSSGLACRHRRGNGGQDCRCCNRGLGSSSCRNAR